MSSEVFVGYAFLQSVIGGDATLLANAPGGFSRSLAPPEDGTPFVFAQHQAGTDMTTFNGVRVLSEQVFHIAVVGPSSQTAQIVAAVTRMDQLLGGTSGGPASGDVIVNSVTIGHVYACYREHPLSLAEVINGEDWDRTGGLYRMQIGLT